METLKENQKECAYCRGTGSVNIFKCNICGELFASKLEWLERDISSCSACGSTVRVRAIIRILSEELFGKNLTISQFQNRPDICGLGLSDWEGYAVLLPRKLNYINTFYHQEPRVDITAIDPALNGCFDFLISTDVFEHVVPPISIAFDNANRLLKPNGVFIFTVPYLREGKTIENFPELYDYEIIKNNDKFILKNLTRDGHEQIFENLVFHGGSGLTLAMRTFTESSILEELSKAGFSDIRVYDNPDFRHGVYWNHEPPRGSLPIAARKKTASKNKIKHFLRDRRSKPESCQCPACDGQGSIDLSHHALKCSVCHGNGSIQAGRCPSCRGTGWIIS